MFHRRFVRVYASNRLNFKFLSSVVKLQMYS
jgi:hypothetical protein